MTTDLELKDIAEKLNFKTPFKGVFMRDELKKMTASENECLILNLNDSKVSPEESSKTGHWTCLFKRKEKKYYFCSYGSPLPEEVKTYLGKSILYHDYVIQPMGTSICGELCLLFLKLMDESNSYADTVLTLLEQFEED